MLDVARRAAGGRPPAARRPTCSPASCRCSTARCSTRPTATRTPGGPLYIVTAASQELAEVLAHVLVLRRRHRHALARCATASTPAGPTARSPTARARRRRSASWPAREGIDLAESYAYSDSESDLPMMRAVGHPVAVNPDSRARARRARGGLADHALRQARPVPADRRAWPRGLALVGGGGGYAAAQAARRAAASAGCADRRQDVRRLRAVGCPPARRDPPPASVTGS